MTHCTLLQAVKSQPGNNIASMINSCIQSWRLTEKLTCVIQDNDVTGMRDPNLDCLAHMLQLVMNEECLFSKAFKSSLELLENT